jgi:CheY-like chemotaxis protein/signal transduction histidine kinase/HAMP domain-containing protein
MTDSTDRPITSPDFSPDFLDQPVLVTPNHIVRVKENEALSGNGNESAGSQSFERSLLLELLRFKAGDFTARLPGELTGLEGKIADAFNEILMVSERRAIETARVCRVVGKEGKLKERMRVPGAAGGWADEIESLNTLIGDLVWPTTEVMRAVVAVAKGDLGQAMALEVDGRPLEGEFLRSAQLINKMIDKLSVFTSEVTRVAREVGTEGKLGGQAQVTSVSGVWKDLTESVNQMAGNLTAQVRNIAEVTIAVARGDLSRKITVDVKGEILELKNTINTMVDRLNAFASEVARVAKEVGTEGRLGGQVKVEGVAGVWRGLTENVNSMASNLTDQVRNIAGVATAVAKGDLSRKITVDVKGEVLELKNTINTMVDQLRSFASEVTRVAREVGTEGKLGENADVPGVAGTWKDLTDSVNFMAANLTNQVRGIVRVVTAVANGDLRQKLIVEAKGEVAALAETINNMTDTLATFAEQVTNVAREVGVDGRLGGQAKVPGASGTWKDLTGNVNLLASNLTGQVRAFAEVATAVTKGDLTRSIQVEARGEVAELKDNINTMIDNLRATTERNQEQDWLKTNLAKFARMLQGQRDLVTVGKMLLSELAPLVDAQQGTVFQMERSEPGEVGDATPGREMLRRLAAYAQRPDQPERIPLGIGLVGQAAAEKQRILLTDVPPGYTTIHSSLGAAPPKSIVVLPVLFEGETMAVIELASLKPFTSTHLQFLDQLTQSIGVVLHTIEATMRTENLLMQSQRLTVELHTRQTELQSTNEELASKAKQLVEQNAEVECKNKEVEHARRALEEKAAELALASKYKSKFLANMSHELRTPLNSILILGQQLAENAGGNLTPKQIDFARNIHLAGTDLLALSNEILDLAKIESGTVTVEPEEITFASILDTVHRNFHHIGENKHLNFEIDIDPTLPRSFTSDPQRLHQILKNLLSNAFKFTAQGFVSMSVRRVTSGWSPDHSLLGNADAAIAFMVTDTGIGIAPEKHKLIFEPFQQADAATSRTYGGTGLGLAISRELANLLGGEIRLVSVPGQGSKFTLYLPLQYTGATREVTAPAPQGPATGMAMPTLTVAKSEEQIPDDRESIQEGDSVLLITEDDPHYARILLGIARTKGFKGIVANRGQQALQLACEYAPTAITLDVFLPDMLGWTVLNNLKLDPRTRHIPVLMLSAEGERQHGLSRGAFSYLVKPATTGEFESALDRLKTFVEPHTKHLLVIEGDERERTSIVELLGHDDVEIVAVATDAEALAQLRTRVFDSCVVDLRLPDMSGFDLLERLQAEPELRGIPVVVFTGKELTAEEEKRLRRIAKSVVVKDVQSPERLLDETSLFLHRVISDLPEAKRKMIEKLHGSTAALRGRKVLVIDDDVRNIFAVTTILESQKMEVLSTTNGRKAIEMIQTTPQPSVVLMDIMMPEMDGYETMREIRKNPKFRTLPILALTAKAMKGDREKCLEAGASDYIAKPVNTDQLLSLLRAWLYR